MESFDRTSQWLIGLVFLAVLLAGAAAAQQLGRRASRKRDEVLLGQVATLQAAVLGLLGLMLAFSFALASQRYDVRRQLVIDEANAIGTSYLRAELLPDPARGEVREALRRYVDARLEFYAARIDDQRLEAAVDKSVALQNQFWGRTVEVARAEPRAFTYGLLLESLNEVIDLHEKRLIALESHVPSTAYGLLLLIAAAAVGTLSFTAGVQQRSNTVAMVLLALLVTSIVLVIIDIDRPRRGLIRISQKSMERLRASVNAPAPPGGPP